MKRLLPVLALLLAASLSPAAGPDYSVVERGPHHRVWQGVVTSTDELGQVSYITNCYTELATGMHYQDPKTGQWVESQEIIESFPGGAIARHGQHQVIFANDLATPGAIDMQTPDGKRLTSHVLGLSYFDASTGTNVLIAEVTNCLGKIVAPNQVIYEHAFDALDASVRYTYTRSGFEQDIILLEAPEPPAAYGLNPATTRLVVMTEFVNPPQPKIQQSMMTDAAGASLEDDTLDLGAMQVGRGSGFLLGSSGAGAGLRIYKQWAVLDGRQFLMEQVRVVDLFKAINSLPSKQGASLTPPSQAIRFTASSGPLPSPKRRKTDNRTMQLATARPLQTGYVLDYTALVSSTNLTLQADSTYYVSGPVTLSGTTTFEGGTVVKYAPTNNARLNLNCAIVCRGSMYRPSIFTARDDSSVGLRIAGASNYLPTNYYAPAMLSLSQTNAALSYLRLSYATKAIEFGGGGHSYSLNHAQLVNCQIALNDTGGDGNVFALNNVLFCNTSNIWNSGSAAYYYGAHLTMDRATNNSGVATYSFTNSLFSATSGFSGVSTTPTSVVAAVCSRRLGPRATTWPMAVPTAMPVPRTLLQNCWPI
jgi:hypothetical protein